MFKTGKSLSKYLILNVCCSSNRFVYHCFASCMKSYLSPVLLFCLSLFFGNLQAQPNQLNLSAITTKDGLASNTVNVILKDRSGWLWAGTDDGLARYDGTNFTIYRREEPSEGSLQSNEILSLHEDKAGNIWIGTSGGSLNKYDRKRDRFQHFPAINKKDAIRNNVIRSVISDSKGMIWIAHFDGITQLDPATGITRDIEISPASVDKTVQIPPTCLYEDSQQNIWIGTGKGLHLYNPAAKTLRYFANLADPSATQSDETVNAIREDKTGTVWIGTGYGLYRYLPQTQSFKKLTNASVNALAEDGKQLWIGTSDGLEIMDLQTGRSSGFKQNQRNLNGLTAKQVRSLFIDELGIYWIGTIGGGINKFDSNLNLFNHVKSNPFDPYGLNDPIVKAFAENSDGNVFIGTEGGGLSLFDPKTQLFKQYSIPSMRAGSNSRIDVLTLKKLPDGKLLIGTYGDGLLVMEPKSGTIQRIRAGNTAANLNANEVFVISPMKNGEIWLGMNGQGINVLNSSFQVIRRYTPFPKHPGDILLPINGYIRDIVEENDSYVWIATHGSGIACLNKKTNDFRVLKSVNSEMPNDKIQCLLKDRRGDLWMGTFGSGIVRFSPKDSSFQTFNEKDGLANSMAYTLVEDSSGLLWVSTNNGISSIDPVRLKINNYNFHNGLQRNNFVRGAALRLRNGELYFGGKEGFNYFNPANLIKNTNIPIVVLTDIKIGNQSVLPAEDGPINDHISVAEEINLDFKQNFTLEYIGLTYTAPLQNTYAYQLEGFDKDWNEVGNLTSASYTNLDPGTYRFRVKASNNDGLWNEAGTSIRVIVHPPFWRTIYAYIFYFLTALGILLYIRYLSLQKWKRKFAQEQEQLKIEQERREVERVRELDRLKIKFLTNLSHEFRTPISLILGPVESLIKKDLPGNDSRQLLLVKHNAKRLLNLVNQLLDFRKMEEHELKLVPTEGDLVPFMKEISQAFVDLADRKKIGFSYTSLIEKLHTSFDHDKLERILFNILSNAFKFTNKGGSVHMSLNWAKRTTTDQTWVEISISDTGIGIPQEQQSSIYDLFFQHQSPASILNQGTGIGLSITKEFVKMHGGQIEMESIPDKGTTFRVLLPLTLLEEPRMEQESSTEINASEEKQNQRKEMVTTDPVVGSLPTVLLVEDNDDFRFYLKDNLRLHYKVFEATNGKEGWQKTLTHHPQLIVSDISMPEMDGIQFCQKIKADKRTMHLPIILLTALTGEDDQLTGLKTGANDYITKPFNFELLYAKIKNLLVLNDTLKTTYSKQIKALTPEVEIQSADEKLLHTILKYLDENLNNSQLSVEELSRQVGMSRSSLYNKLLELTGQTPVEFIRSVKLEKAAILLEKSDMNVAEIAYSVGFSTPNYFAKSFKAKYNMLPSEYIAKVRKENAS